jgi:sarcosine oxidase, subunit delta
MMRLPCPWCGECDEIEFVYGGPSSLLRPALESDDAMWGRYLYFRANVKGRSAERWRHAYGCGQWFNLLRNSLTHRVSAALKFGEAVP